MAIQHHSTKLCEYLARTAEGKFILAGTFLNLNATSFPFVWNMAISVEFTGNNGDHYKVFVDGPKDSGFELVLLDGILELRPIQKEFEQWTANVSGSSPITFPQAGVYRVVLQSNDEIVHEYPFGVYPKTDEEKG